MFTDPQRAAGHPFRIRYAARATMQDESLLAAFAIGNGPADAAALRLPLPIHEGGLCQELWQVTGPVTRREAYGARISEDGQLLAATWTLEEAEHGGIEAAAEAVYRQIAELTADSGYPHLVKVWHYLGAINETPDDGGRDDERYRRFCVGRAKALAPGQPLPAATAVGIQARPQELIVFLLAAKVEGIRIENPRQVPAFEYPRAYGPVSPSFSRAMLMPWGQLFVSGTAAVVGHASCHPENTGAQLRELVLNLDALVARAESLGGQRLVPAALKIYVRHRDDLAEVEALASRLFPIDCPRLIVLADISRADLRVEVEALYEPQRAKAQS
ncbi:pteridine-dependent deoxygenase [Nevskia ramosa]|uniref:chorismate transformation enzyme, FkbO/Hyg5 family n=1 Tax=Nevskia ramosa TaxID=64002 RepID=UPI003D0C1840